MIDGHKTPVTCVLTTVLGVTAASSDVRALKEHSQFPPHRKEMCVLRNSEGVDILFHFIYSGCEPRIPGKVNLITVLTTNPWREDDRRKFNFRSGSN